MEAVIKDIKTFLSDDNTNNQCGNDSIYVSPDYIKYKYRSVVALIFEVTEACNIECEYCGYGRNYLQTKYRPHNRGLHMTWEIAKVILDEYLSIWQSLKGETTVFISFYGGEPLLNFSLIKQITTYLETNKQEKIKVEYNITTNGLLLYKYIDFFDRYNFRVSVSLDGDKEADSFRKTKTGKETYELIGNILDKIRLKYPVFFDNNIFFQSVINTRSSTISVNRYLYGKYSKGTLPIEISTSGLAPDNQIKRYFKDLNKDIACSYKTNKEECELYGISDPYLDEVKSILQTISVSSFSSLDYLMKDQSHGKRSVTSASCRVIGKRLFISAAGYIFQCEKTKLDKPIGNISEGSVHIDFEALADDYNTIFAKYEKQCAKCFNRLSCPQCLSIIYNYALPETKCPSFAPITKSRIVNSLKLLKNRRKEILALIK